MTKPEEKKNEHPPGNAWGWEKDTMAARVWTIADAQGVVNAWESSWNTMSSRWPESAGGPASVPHMNLVQAQALIGLPDNTGLVSVSGSTVLAWMGLRYGAADHSIIRVEPVAVLAAGSQNATITRLKTSLKEMLLLMANNVPGATVILARFPIIPANDTGIPHTIDQFLDNMTTKNGITATSDGSFRHFSLTAQKVIQGLT